VCDHAGRTVPRRLGQLGLDDGVLDRHVAWDIGAADVAVALAGRLDAPLVIDPNRALDDPTAFPAISDGILIPGNHALSDADRAARDAACRAPYHAAIAAMLDAFAVRGVTPAVIAVHTCTPVFGGVTRPWEVGVMWDEDPRIAVPLMAALAAGAVCVGDNEPYSGRDPDDFTLDTHAEGRRLPYVGLEVRQDLVGTPDDARRWAGILADALTPLLADDRLYRPFTPAPPATA
jgi:predicted N-formylglutamate amidohydrolase